MKIRSSALLLASTTLLGCTTPQYDWAREQCRREASVKYPPNLQNRVVERSRMVEVPDGTSSCRTYSMGYTVYTDCEQGTKYVTEYYNDNIVVDLNERARRSFIDSCTASRCISTYGNRQCKPVKPKNTAAPNNPTNPAKTSANLIRSTLISTESMQGGKRRCTYKTSSNKTFSYMPSTACPFVVMYDESKRLVYPNHTK